jgi:hypothetical protein
MVRGHFETMYGDMVECMKLEPDIEQLCNIIRSFTEVQAASCVFWLIDIFGNRSRLPLACFLSFCLSLTCAVRVSAGFSVVD